MYKTKVVHIGGIPIGGGNPIVIQSMTSTDTRDWAATIKQIHELQDAGCEIVRVAVPDIEAAEAIKKIKAAIKIPLVADIHFNHELAILSAQNGADKIRINPGNIGSEANIKKVTDCAKAYGLPIRIGVNSGSLNKEILQKHNGKVTAEGLAESALQNVHSLEKNNFDSIVVSVKAANVQMLIKAHEILSREISYPLHVGLTHIGTPYNGTVRSAAGLGALLNKGFGDTIRVSLSGNPVEEITAAKQILIGLGLRQFGPVVHACPMCGRTDFNIAQLADEIERRVEGVSKILTIAVMGCVVNGPGEAREADIGVACGKDTAVLFSKGEIIRKLNKNEIVEAVIEAVNDI